MPISAPFDGEYGKKNIFAGFPCVIGANDVEKIMEYELPANEKAAFKEYCDTIRAIIARVAKLLK
jgi:L-lactate dehydrogenase